MEFSIEAKALKTAIDRVKGVTEKKNTIPVLSNVLVVAGDGAVRLTASDLEIEVSVDVGGGDGIKTPGATTVSSHMLHDIAAKLDPGALVHFEMSDSSVSVKAGRSRFKLLTLDPKDFPATSMIERTATFEVPGKTLKKVIDSVQFAISTEEKRYYLNGIHMHVADDKLAFVATDGHRLSLAKLPLPMGAETAPGIIIPRKTVKLIDDLAKIAGETPVRVSVSRTQIEVSIEGARMISRLIDGTFPDYRRVIPSGADKVAVIDAPAFTKMIDRVSTVSSERGRGVKLSFGDGKVMALVHNPDAGNATEDMEVDYSGPPLDIGFSSRYLHDVLTAVSADTIRVELTDPGSPTIYRNAGADDDRLIVLMPMRV